MFTKTNLSGTNLNNALALPL
ncbi:hypothetical protein GQ593_04130 [Gilliamella sp. Pas-s25]|nr:hypothetical protein [Gilliamella sp. Pas-s25]